MKPVFIILNIILILSIGYLCFQAFYPDRQAQKQIFSDKPPESPESKNHRKKISAVSGDNSYKEIRSRNLFNIANEKKKETQAYGSNRRETIPPAPPTGLDLKLLGTVTAVENPYAVIEDNQTRIQGLYRIGDRIQDATLKKIYREKVILVLNGRDYVLELDSKLTAALIPESQGSAESQTDIPNGAISIPQASVESSLSDLDSLKRQIKFRPLTGNGKSEGILVYGISPNSIFKTMKLENGDVIQKVNNQKITSVKNVMALYIQMKDNPTYTVTLLRRGKSIEQIYHFEASE